MSSPNIPTEYEEQVTLIQWLNLKGIKYFHVPNSTYTKSFNQKRRNKALGVMPGVPDIFVPLPGIGLVAIELKRQKLGVVSEHQKAWIETLNECPGTAAHVAKGADEAIRIIESYLPTKPLPVHVDELVF